MLMDTGLPVNILRILLFEHISLKHNMKQGMSLQLFKSNENYLDAIVDRKDDALKYLFMFENINFFPKG